MCAEADWESTGDESERQGIFVRTGVLRASSVIHTSVQL